MPQHAGWSAADAIPGKTECSIDFSLDDVGLEVDGRGFISADAMVDAKDVLLSSGMETLIDRFIHVHTATLYLRFWPIYQVTPHQAARR